MYLALSGETLDELVKPHLQNEWHQNKHLWFPKVDTPENAAYDRRTPGTCKKLLELLRFFLLNTYKLSVLFQTTKSNLLCINLNLTGKFKVEWAGEGLIGLAPKTYYCYIISNPSGDKYSSKGINKTIKLTREHFLSVLNSKKPSTNINRGFIMKENQMLTYSMAKDGLSYLYCKRKVLNDGISTTYLDI